MEIDLLIPDGVTLTRHRPLWVRGLRTMAMRGVGLALRHGAEPRIVGRTRDGWRDEAMLCLVDLEALFSILTLM